MCVRTHDLSRIDSFKEKEMIAGEVVVLGGGDGCRGLVAGGTCAERGEINTS